MHTISAVLCSEERHFGALEFKLFAVQNKALQLCHIEQVYEVGIVVLVVCPIDYYAIVDADHTRALLHDDIHLHLEDVL